MNTSSLLLEMYSRIPPLARAAVDGVPTDALTRRPAAGANTIAWLIWHLTRVADHHVAELRQADQVWAEGAWARRLGLQPDPANTGYGHTAEQVATVRPEDGRALLDYLDAVDAVTQDLLRGITDADLDRIVDRRWDPPVTLGVRLVSIADDGLQHAGQAAYVRGLLGV